MKTKLKIGSLIDSEMIGQTAIKNEFNFFLNGYKNGENMPIFFFTGAKGHGKTEFAKLVFQEMKSIHALESKGDIAFAEVNCSQFQNPTQFFEELIGQIQGKNMVILLDECHDLPKPVQTALLTPFGSTQNTIHVEWRGTSYEFDRRKMTFILATTNPEKMLEPLINRMKEINFKPYSHSEIRDILVSRSGKISICDSISLEVAQSCRKSPRIAVMQILPNIKRSLGKSKKKFTKCLWEDYKKLLNVYPLGLSEVEARFLLYLSQQNGSAKNQAIAAHLKLDQITVRNNIQSFLLSADLIYIGDGSARVLTQNGRKVVEKLKELIPEEEEEII